MSFAAFCLCHSFDARLRWRALEQLMQRRRLARERTARFARLIAQVAGEPHGR